MNIRRIRALAWKETLQIFRDPSSIVIAFVLPVVMLFIFGYGINLDSASIRVGLVLQDTRPEARHFAAALTASPYLTVVSGQTIAEMSAAITAGSVRGFIVVPPDFGDQLHRPDEPVPIQVITDGGEPQIATFVENYARGAVGVYQADRADRLGQPRPERIRTSSRFWYNPAAVSRNYLIPGSITVIMTVVGALLTSLVVAREWERGTMEALLATPVTRGELLLSKILPYYVLGIASLLVCVATAVFLMHVPFRGSIFILLVIASFFLLSALGLGLLLSTVTRNQFNAAQAALNAAFLPALMLSGFIYEISSMPIAIRAVTYLIPARYFVTAMQTIFQAGTIWPILWKSLAFLIAAAAFFLTLTYRKTKRTLD